MVGWLEDVEPSLASVAGRFGPSALVTPEQKAAFEKQAEEERAEAEEEGRRRREEELKRRLEEEGRVRMVEEARVKKIAEERRVEEEKEEEEERLAEEKRIEDREKARIEEEEEEERLKRIEEAKIKEEEEKRRKEIENENERIRQQQQLELKREEAERLEAERVEAERVYNPLPLNSQGHPRDLRSRHRRRNLGPSRRDDGAGKRFLRFLKQGFIVIRSYRYFVPTFALTLPTPTPTPTYLVHPRRSRLNGKEPPRPDLNPSEGVRVLGGWVVGGR